MCGRDCTPFKAQDSESHKPTLDTLKLPFFYYFKHVFLQIHGASTLQDSSVPY